jgi:hypothetical protein
LGRWCSKLPVPQLEPNSKGSIVKLIGGEMPRFHFPIIDGIRLDDPVGIEFPNEEAAREHANIIAGHMPASNRRIAVENSDGKEVHSVTVDKDEAAETPAPAK